MASKDTINEASDMANKALFLEKVKLSNAACQSGDFEKAISLYTEAIKLDPANHILYSNRSAALIKLGQFSKALKDAVKAKELNADWPKAYYRQGVALQCLARHAEALGAFANGLAQDPKSPQLLDGLVEAAMKSPLRPTLEPTYRQLEAMKLDKSPFVIISVIGQELLAQGKYNNAVEVLESALKIGTCSPKLRGSVFSALSSAFWALNSLDKAIGYMQQDLVVAKSLNDISGECRAHGNLGAAQFSKGNFKEALTSHRYQLVLAMKCKDSLAAASALTSLGHVYTAIGDYQNALASHKQCVDLVRTQLNDSLQEAREIGNVGAVYLAIGDFDKAVECHTEHLKLAESLNNQVEAARAYSNLGSSHHYKRNFEQAMVYHNHVLKIAQELKDRSIEARAYAGLGHAARCTGDILQAKMWHEKQLDMALVTKDKVAEGRACSNLGIVYQLFGDPDAALKLHQAHLNIARQMHDKAGMGRAYGNIGNAYSAAGAYEEAIKYHKQELTISKEVNDRSSEAATHGNLAVAYQALGKQEMALVHYHSHLNIARELKDVAGEACALCNLGNCHSSRGEFSQAVPFYENYLMLSQELNDIEGEAKACHFLGYAHYCLSNYKEAVRYYDQDLALARDQQDRMSMGRAYCNLGLAHLALGNFDEALECQKYFLALTQVMKHGAARFRAFGNMADVLMKMGKAEEAISIYQKQLGLSKQSRDKRFEASAYGSLGVCHRMAKQFDKSLGYHTQELSILQDLDDARGECRAHGNLGAVHLSLANYINAMKCYQEQLEKSKEVKDPFLEATAYGNLGISKMSLGRHEEAIGCFEQQIAYLEQWTDPLQNKDIEKGRAFGHLGKCYEALNDFDESAKCHELYLSHCLKTKSIKDQDKAYQELGQAYKHLGNLQQALVCLEKRLVVAHDLDHPGGDAKRTAYGELGEIHAMLGNYEQAISCMEHQLQDAKDTRDFEGESKAASSLGEVFLQMGEFESALEYHQMDYDISESHESMEGKIRALSQMGLTQEAMGHLAEAVGTQENHLTLANKENHLSSRVQALSSLGRLHFHLGQIDASVSYLEQALAATEGTEQRADEAVIRYRLGMALWQQNLELEEAKVHLDKSALILEMVRRETSSNLPKIVDGRMATNYKLTLFDIQTQCYQALQRILVTLGKENEALVIAERARIRAFVDLLQTTKDNNSSTTTTKSSLTTRLDDWTPNNESQLVSLVNRQKACVLYFSIADNYLYSWLVVPTRGIIKFHQTELPTNEEGNSILEDHIQNARETLGVEQVCKKDYHDNGGTTNEAHEEASLLSNRRFSHLDALADKLNSEGDKTGFFQMVNRSSRLNASSYSLSSLYSVGSLNCGSTISGFTTGSRHESVRSKRFSVWQGPSAIKLLYNLLLEPMEDELPEEGAEIMLVLDSTLFMVPWAMLKGSCNPEIFSERYSIILAPSLTSTRFKPKGLNKSEENAQKLTSFVVGNPKLPSSVMEHWNWPELPRSAREAENMAEILQTPSQNVLIGEKATKSAVLSQLTQAECIHFACHISWQLSAIVLSPGEFVESNNSDNSPNHEVTKNKRFSTIEEEAEENTESTSTTADMPALSDFLLTAAEILSCRLSAKLVVLSCGHFTSDDEDQANSLKSSDGLMALVKAILAAGAQSVLVTLWPVPDSATNLVMKPFYSALLQGTRLSRALSDALITVQNTKHFAHPANWAGFALIGSDIRLSNRVAQMSQALRDILATNESCRDILRVTLHLVEKSLQRINRGSKTAMYTSQQSIEKKVHSSDHGSNTEESCGWKDLLMSVGFRFEPASNGIPPSVFFPQSDPGERLTQCSASLQAVLGLIPSSWRAMSKLCEACPSMEASDEIIALFRQVVVHMNNGEMETAAVEVPVNVRLWRVPGCHELLASLGFDLMEVGKEDVILKTGKSANKRQIQFALQALLALFDPQDAPRSLEIDEEDISGEEDSKADELDGVQTPAPSPRKQHSFLLDNNRSSAFTSYIKKRGEPDGRQSGNPDSPTAGNTAQASSSLSSTSSSTTSTPLLGGNYFKPGPIQPPPWYHQNTNHPKGHESDCNFTPSPVEPHPKSLLYGERPSKMFGTLPSDSPILNSGTPLKPAGMFTPRYSHTIDDSSSSAGSLYDTGREHHHHPTLAMRQPITQMRRHALLQQNKSAQHLHPSCDVVANVSALRTMGNTVPLYENTDFSTKQPAGRPILPIRSVFTDVGYQSTLKLQDKSDPNDKFNVRTEIGKFEKNKKQTEAIPMKPIDPSKEARLNPGVIKRVPPTGESGSPENTYNASISDTSSVKSDQQQKQQSSEASGGEQELKESIFKSQMRRLNRELPISDVYHERNIGLGMAPPLSKLIMTNNLQVVQVDHHSSDSETGSLHQQQSSQPLSMQSLMNATRALEESFGNIDNLSVIEDAHKRNSLASSAKTVIIKETPPQSLDLEPRGENPISSSIMPTLSAPAPSTSSTVSTSSIITPNSKHVHYHQRPPVPPRSQEPWYNAGIYGHYHGPVTRDEGDGRSMTDSQYSGYSPNQGQPRIHNHKGAESLASQINYMKMRDFMNDQEITVLEEKEVSPPNPSSRINKKSEDSNNSNTTPHRPQQQQQPKYMNTSQMGPISESMLKRRPINILPSQQSPLDPRNSRNQPQKIWDKNSGFTYTGMFSSDC